jgi:hypothetical protein
MASYREDNPAYDHRSDDNFTFDARLFSVGNNSQITYRYGEHTGYATAAQSVTDQLQNLCAANLFQCQSAHCK